MMDIHDGASVRNLERIQETHGAGGARGATFGLVVAGAAVVLFGALAFGARRTTSGTTAKKADPLAELATKPTPSTLQPGEVTFPGMLSDRASPATALAAANGPAASASATTQAGAQPTTASTFPLPPPATDKLPVFPLPARHAPASESAKPRGKDRLTVLASDAVDPVSSGASLAPSGADGGWQLQVASYRSKQEAETIASQLRARGHKAHVQRAEIPNRGTYFRVKIGPFTTQYEAARYRTSFETKEKIPSIVVHDGAPDAR
jgi:cell division septation protein DedD